MSKVKVSTLAEEFEMDVKEVLSVLNSYGLKAARRNSSVDEAEARQVLQGTVEQADAFEQTNVVSITKARKNKKQPTTKKVSGPKPGKVGSPEWYARYPHVVKGSVREPNAGDKKILGAKCHGKVCTIKCVDTGGTRVINTQDAFQVKRTVEAQRKYMKQRRADRRAAKRQTRKAQNA